jgi:hypothetical protein
MTKAAKLVRQLGAENESLKERVDSLEKTASSLGEIEKRAEAAKIILQLVADGEVDPEDALEKYAEVLTLTPEQIKLVLRKAEIVKIGHVDADSTADDSDPITTFLLGM